MEPTINRKKCRGCQQCVDICTSEMFHIIHSKIKVNHGYMCRGCMECIQVCLFDAIKLIDIN